jgi:hypothetical protein
MSEMECLCCGDKFIWNGNAERKYCSHACLKHWEQWVLKEQRVSFSGARCLGYDTGVNKETRIGTCNWCEDEFKYTTSFARTKQTWKSEPRHCSKMCFDDERTTIRIREGEWSYYAQIRNTYVRRRKAEYPMNFAETLHSTKYRAKEKGIPFDLDEDYLYNIKTKTCPVLGYKLVVGKFDNGASLDRFNPKLGYVKGNVHYISNRANRIKTNAAWYEVIQVGLWMMGVALVNKVIKTYRETFIY